MDFLKYISENLLILIPVVYVVGMLIKGTEKIKDKFIPIILAVFAIVMSIVYTGFVLEVGFTPASITDAFVQGLLITGASVLINQIPKQLSKDE